MESHAFRARVIFGRKEMPLFTGSQSNIGEKTEQRSQYIQLDSLDSQAMSEEG